MELILPWAAEKPQQAERCESVCLAEVLPVGGREAEQVMAAALTQRGCNVFQQAANVLLRSGSSATGGDTPSLGRHGRLMALGSK